MSARSHDGTETTAVRHESDAFGRLERVERAPHPLLEGIVRRYCGY
jgi:hypothetical protein